MSKIKKLSDPSETQIFFLEKDIKTRHQVSSRLRMQGFKVEAPTSGMHALSLIEENPCHIVLLTGEMSDMTALEMASLIKDKFLTDVKILFYYKEDSKFLIDELQLADIDGALPQDKNFNLLVEKLKELGPKK